MAHDSHASSANSTSVNTPTSNSSNIMNRQSTPTAKSALRRAAIDIIGRGFVLWEPHLEVSKVLLGLLEMCCEADWWVPSSKYGLPLTAAGDSCRTSRLALTSIARVRPAVFITSISKEIARYNNLAANAQALNINVEGLSIGSQIVVACNLFRNGRDENSRTYSGDRGQR